MTKKLIIDTDIGGDCDDAGALALANLFVNKGDIEVVGITFTTSCKYGPSCISAIDTYYGNANIPVAATSRKNFCENVNDFQRVLATSYPNKLYDAQTQTLTQVPDAVRFLRNVLADSDEKTDIVCIGQLNNASDLLDSLPDDISPLNGAQLVAEKVGKFSVMGGLFNETGEPVSFHGQTYTTEYNIATDVASAANFVRKCPVEVVFCDFLVGYNVYTGKTLLSQGKNNPVGEAYRIFQNSPRESWDPLTLWYAVKGEDDIFRLSPWGKVTVEDDGTTVFRQDSDGKHRYLRLADTEQNVAKKLDDFLGE